MDLPKQLSAEQVAQVQEIILASGGSSAIIKQIANMQIKFNFEVIQQITKIFLHVGKAYWGAQEMLAEAFTMFSNGMSPPFDEDMHSKFKLAVKTLTALEMKTTNEEETEKLLDILKVMVQGHHWNTERFVNASDLIEIMEILASSLDDKPLVVMKNFLHLAGEFRSFFTPKFSLRKRVNGMAKKFETHLKETKANYEKILEVLQVDKNAKIAATQSTKLSNGDAAGTINFHLDDIRLPPGVTVDEYFEKHLKEMKPDSPAILLVLPTDKSTVEKWCNMLFDKGIENNELSTNVAELCMLIAEKNKTDFKMPSLNKLFKEKAVEKIRSFVGKDNLTEADYLLPMNFITDLVFQSVICNDKLPELWNEVGDHLCRDLDPKNLAGVSLATSFMQNTWGIVEAMGGEMAQECCPIAMCCLQVAIDGLEYEDEVDEKVLNDLQYTLAIVQRIWLKAE